MICLTWNLEWASPASKRGKRIAEQIGRTAPDVACYTEILGSSIPQGHTIEADADYGYPDTGEKRKVVLWSKSPWMDVDCVGDSVMPSGRFISGITQGTRVVGVCIPWKDAHVRTGRRDREPWEDHLAYCDGLKCVLQRYASGNEPVCILGDYNQRIPRINQPEPVYKALMDAIPGSFTIITEKMKDPDGKRLIDHVALSGSLYGEVIEIISRMAEDGTRLSDHSGVVVNLTTDDWK